MPCCQGWVMSLPVLGWLVLSSDWPWEQILSSDWLVSCHPYPLYVTSALIGPKFASFSDWSILDLFHLLYRCDSISSPWMTLSPYLAYFALHLLLGPVLPGLGWRRHEALLTLPPGSSLVSLVWWSPPGNNQKRATFISHSEYCQAQVQIHFVGVYKCPQKCPCTKFCYMPTVLLCPSRADPQGLSWWWWGRGTGAVVEKDWIKNDNLTKI